MFGRASGEVPGRLLMFVVCTTNRTGPFAMDGLNGEGSRGRRRPMTSEQDAGGERPTARIPASARCLINNFGYGAVGRRGYRADPFGSRCWSIHWLPVS